MAQLDRLFRYRRGRPKPVRRAGLIAVAVGVSVVVAVMIGSLTSPVTQIEAPFPDGRVLAVRIPSEIARETVSRELSFFVERDSAFRAQVVVTDNPEDRQEFATGENILAHGDPTDWRLISGQAGLVDRVTMITQTWAVVIGMPETADSPNDVIGLVEVIEDKGLPVVELTAGTRLAQPSPGGLPALAISPQWFYRTAQGGEWVLGAISSCEEIQPTATVTHREMCSVEHGVYVSISGDEDFVGQMFEYPEILGWERQ